MSRLSINRFLPLLALALILYAAFEYRASILVAVRPQLGVVIALSLIISAMVVGRLFLRDYRRLGTAQIMPAIESPLAPLIRNHPVRYWFLSTSSAFGVMTTVQVIFAIVDGDLIMPGLSLAYLGIASVYAAAMLYVERRSMVARSPTQLHN